MLGAGRETVDSDIDYSAGITLKLKVGDAVKAGDVLAVMYASKDELFASADKKFKDAVTIEETNIEEEPLIFARVEKGNIQKFI